MYTGFRDLPAALRRRPGPPGAPGSETDPTAPGQGIRVPGFVWGLGVVSLLTDASTEMIGTSLPLYLSTWLRVGPLALASVDAFQQAMTAVMRMGTALVADRTRRPRMVATAGYLTSALSRLLLIFGAPTTGMVAGSVIVDRVGKGIRTGPRDALITAGSPSGRLGAAFGVHRSLDAVGAFLGPLLTYVILRATNGTGFRAVFMVAALVGGLGVTAMLLLVPPTPRLQTAIPRPPRTSKPPLQLLVTAGLVGCCTVGDALVLIVLLRSAALSNATYPLLAVAASFFFAVLAGPFGRLADRVRPMRIYLGGTIALALTYVMLGQNLPASQGSVIVVLAAIGCSYAATDGVLAAIVAHASTAGSLATAQASVQTASSLGRAVGSATFGLLWASYGPSRAFQVFGIALIAATAFSGAINRSHPMVNRTNQHHTGRH